MRRRAPWPTLLFLTVFAPACASAVRDSTRAAAPEAVKGTIESAYEPTSRQQLAEILADPQLGIGAAKMTEAVTSGVVQGLTSAENWNALQEQSRQLMIRLGADLTRGVARELRPEIVAMVEQSVDRALSRVLSEETEQRATAFATALTRAIMQGIGRELASMDLTSASTAQGAAALARQISRGATLGAQDAVRETKERSNAGAERDGDILADADQALSRGADLMSAGTLIPLGVALAAITGLVWALRRTRQYKKASEANQEATQILAQAIQSDPNNPSLQALRERLDVLSRDELAPGVMRQHAEQRPVHRQRQH